MFDNCQDSCCCQQPQQCCQPSNCPQPKQNCCCGCRNESVVNAVSNTPVTVDGGFPITFDTNRVVTGNAINHVPGSADFTTFVPGVYRVTFVTDAVPAVGSTATTVFATIAINGVVIPGTQAAETVTAGGTARLATQAVYAVQEGTTAVLSILNPVGAGSTTYTNPNIIVEKIC